jgi:hypothetical protein
MEQRKFSTEIEAAEFLLFESTSILLKHKVEFAVVGGWSPFLFHRSKFGHPGTFDVDILLHENSLDDRSFESASEAMLNSGYMRAPKNIFQAHRILDVGGENLVFHIDFLNERDTGNEIDLVVGSGRMKSVYTPPMKAIFNFQEYRAHKSYPKVNFPSPATFIVTKAAAIGVKKRKRDAFDVFVTAQDQGADFKVKWAALCEQDGLFSNANDALLKAIRNGDAVQKISNIFSEMQAAKIFMNRVPNSEEITSGFSFLV